MVCMQQALPVTNAQSATTAKCQLQVLGQPSTGGIAYAGLQCTGGTVTIAVNEMLLGKYKNNFTGVTWHKQHCFMEHPDHEHPDQDCLFAVCANTRALFFNTIVKEVSNTSSIFCVLDNSSIEIVDSTVAFNSATGITAENANVTIINCTVAGCKSTGISVFDSILSITGDTVIANNTGLSGGGIKAFGSNCTVSITGSTSIVNNTAVGHTGQGGGVYAGPATVRIGGNTVIAHNSVASGAGEGGGVYVGTEASLFVFDNASIIYNSAYGDMRGMVRPTGHGGGVFVQGNSTVSIAGNARIAHNVAGGEGGGVCVAERGDWPRPTSNSIVTLSGNAVISHNSAADGGGIWIDSEAAAYLFAFVSVLGNATVSNNSATGDGGGMWCGPDSCGVTIADNALLANNSAGVDGGAVYAGPNSLLRMSGTPLFKDNVASRHGAAIVAQPNSSVYITGALFYNNHAGIFGDDIYAPFGAQLVFKSRNVSTQSDTVYWQRTTCVLGEVKTSWSRFCWPCPMNMYSLNVANQICDPCPANANCTGRSVLLPTKDYWHSHMYSTQMHKCAKAGVCLVNDTCASGYNGNLCGRCSPGYGSVGAFTCGPCRTAAFTVAVYVVAWCALVVLVVILVHTTLHDNVQQIRSLRPSDLLKVLIRHVQYLILLVSVRLPWSNTLAYLFSVVGWVFSASTAQIVSLDCILQSVHIAVPSAIAKTLISLLTPVTIFVAVLLLRMLVGSVRRRKCCVCTLTELVVAFLVVMFFFYPILVQTSLGMFACIKVDNAQAPLDPYPQYAIANASRGYWMWDVQQECGEGWHLRWSLGLGLPCVIAFCVLVPLGMLALLYHNREKLDVLTVKAHIGFLYHCFTARMYYWEVVATVQTILVVIVSTYSFSLGAYHAALIMLVCFLGIVATQYVYKPYAFEQVQYMQLLSNICLVLTVMIGMSLFESADVVVPDAYKEAICAVALLMNVALMCWCAWRGATLQLTGVREWVSLKLASLNGLMGRRSNRGRRRRTSCI